MINLFYTVCIQQGELYFCGLKKKPQYLYADLHPDAYELIYFRLGMMLDTSKFNSAIPVLMPFTLTGSHGYEKAKTYAIILW